jgi:hypothetical protein
MKNMRHEMSVILSPYVIKSRTKNLRELYPKREVTNIKEKLLNPNEILPEFLLPTEASMRDREGELQRERQRVYFVTTFL